MPITKRRKSRSPAKRRKSRSPTKKRNATFAMDRIHFPPPPRSLAFHKSFGMFQNPLEFLRCEQRNHHARLNNIPIQCICRANPMIPGSREYQMFIDGRPRSLM